MLKAAGDHAGAAAWAIYVSQASGTQDPANRKATYCLLGLLCAQLANRDTVGFLFRSERIFARNSEPVLCKLASGRPLDPVELSSASAAAR